MRSATRPKTFWAWVGAAEVRQSGLSYRIRPSVDDPDNLWIQERWQAGDWRQFCRYDLRPSTDSARAEAYQRHHVRGQSWVVDLPRPIRCTPDSVLVWVPHQLTRYTASPKYTEALSSPDAIRTLFGLPNLPLQEALAAAV